jgi:protein associated with RNAse G/E
MSVNGNPNYRIHLDNGNVYRTSSDSSVVYEIDNAVFRGVTVRLLLTETAHRIWDISVI